MAGHNCLLMNKKAFRHRVPLVALPLTLLFLSACAVNERVRSPSNTPIKPVSVAQAQQDEALPLLESVLKSPSSSGGAQAIWWGGTISRVENLADQKTLLEIVSRPLRSNGRPVHNDRSFGRFVAVVDEFLDPEIVTEKRDITVVASLSARVNGKVGQSNYVFPVVNVESYTYWKKQQPRPVVHFPHWNTHPHWFDDPLWRAWYRRQLQNRAH